MRPVKTCPLSPPMCTLHHLHCSMANNPYTYFCFAEEITKKDHISKCLERIECEREELRRTTDGLGTEVHDTLIEYVKQDLQVHIYLY